MPCGTVIQSAPSPSDLFYTLVPIHGERFWMPARRCSSTVRRCFRPLAPSTMIQAPRTRLATCPVHEAGGPTTSGNRYDKRAAGCVMARHYTAGPRRASQLGTARASAPRR